MALESRAEIQNYLVTIMIKWKWHQKQKLSPTKMAKATLMLVAQRLLHFLILVTGSYINRLGPNHWRSWWTKCRKPLATSQTCHQHILSPTSMSPALSQFHTNEAKTLIFNKTIKYNAITTTWNEVQSLGPSLEILFSHSWSNLVIKIYSTFTK